MKQFLALADPVTEINIYRPSTTEPGILEFERRATIGEWWDKLEAALPKSSAAVHSFPQLMPTFEWFDLCHYPSASKERFRERVFPERATLHCTAREGGSEGQFVSIVMSYPSENLRKPWHSEDIVHGKTFYGLPFAWHMAQLLDSLINGMNYKQRDVDRLLLEAEHGADEIPESEHDYII